MQSMQLTDWLVVIFVVAIVVVLVDGVRRKLAERRSRVVMKLERNIPQDVDPEELPNSELPNGGARTLERGDEPPPSLRTLQARRKRSFRSLRTAEDSGVRAVPVLLDTVDIEEERIEHTNVFGDPHAVAASEVDDFGAADAPGHDADASMAPAAEADDELIDGLDEEYEEDAMLAPEIARKEPGYMDTRYMGRRDDDDEDEYEDDEEEYEDEEEEEDDEDDEDDGDLEEFDEDLDEFGDEDDEEEDDDDYDDEDDYDEEDEDDEDGDYDDEEDEEDDEDLDELEGLPEDDWGSEEEEGRLVDDYENEPMPLQGAFDKAASTLDKVASQAATQFDKVASQAATRLDQVATHAASQFDRAAAQAANHLKRPPRDAEQQRIEPGFGGDASAEQFDDPAFSEDFSATWAEDEFDATPDAIVPEQAAERPQYAAAKREQGELFSETPARGSNARDARDARKGREGREESRLMAALQKAVPARAPQPEPEPEPAAPQFQEVIIINVMARHGQMLHGGDLLRVLQRQGMRLGDMSIFHRHADSSGTGPTMFSMANMVKPGTFDLASMEDFATPGVSFFLQMPNRLGNMNCFEKMLATASSVRDAFDAELKDEQRSTFTRQTVEHCRQRVRDLELKLLSRK